MSDNRKATDVLLSIESKLEALLNHHRSQELNLKILSNKFNSFLDTLPKMIAESKDNKPKITVEVADAAPNHLIKTNSQFVIPQTSEPGGARRTSRSETDEEQDFREYKPAPPPTEAPRNIAPPVKKEVVLAPETSQVIQVTQRVIDKNQKSIFLAEVEVKTMDGETIHKTRTNSVGKWVGSLKPGKYRVSVNKRESSMKQKIEVSQDIEIGNDRAILVLQDLIVK